MTLPRVDLTSGSSLTGLSVTPVAFSIFSAAAPHGTCGAQTTTLRSGLARSAKEAMPFGLPGAVAICSTLVAKTVGGAGGEAGVGDGLHGRVAGGGEDVGRGAVDDLLGQVGRRRRS